MKPLFRQLCLAGVLSGVAATGEAQAAATILLWPIDPWLAADANATELWIQNQGNSATTMQVRIVRWKQEGDTNATARSRTWSPARPLSPFRKAINS